MFSTVKNLLKNDRYRYLVVGEAGPEDDGSVNVQEVLKESISVTGQAADK